LKNGKWVTNLREEEGKKKGIINVKAQESGRAQERKPEKNK